LSRLKQSLFRSGLCCFLFLLVGHTCFAAQSSGYVVAGVVINSVTHQALPDINVALAPDRAGGPSTTVLTDQQGRFRLPPVTAGKYILSASGLGYRAQGLNQHGYYFSAVVTGPNQDNTSIVFHLQPNAGIRGQVTDEQSEPVRNATAQLFAVDDSTGTRKITAVTNAGTNDQGYYTFPQLAPGTYYVAISARPWYAQYAPHSRTDPQRPVDADSAQRAQQEKAQLDMAYPLTFYPDATDSGQAGAINLTPGERVTADIVLRAVAAANLTIRSDTTSREAPPQILQRVFDGLTIPVLATQGYGYSRGVYEFAGLAPGHYVVEMPRREPGGKGWFRELDLYGTTELSAADSAGMANITGMVVYEGGTPTRNGGYLELSNLGSGDSWTGPVSDKGLFGLKDNDLRPGVYEATLYPGDDWLITRIVAQNAKVQGTQITLAPGASARLVLTATRINSNVTGTVMLNDKPLGGAMVLLVPDDFSHQSSRVRRDQSDMDGSFTLRQVAPGQYTALAIQDGWNLEWGDPQVLQPYLAHGRRITVAAGQSPGLKLQAQ
jgi:hypothetical protein